MSQEYQTGLLDSKHVFLYGCCGWRAYPHDKWLPLAVCVVFACVSSSRTQSMASGSAISVSRAAWRSTSKEGPLKVGHPVLSYHLHWIEKWFHLLGYSNHRVNKLLLSSRLAPVFQNLQWEENTDNLLLWNVCHFRVLPCASVFVHVWEAAGQSPGQGSGLKLWCHPSSMQHSTALCQLIFFFLN